MRTIACLILSALAAPALAMNYAAMDTVPATGGELRLVAPRVDSGAQAIAFPLTRTDVKFDIDGPVAQVTLDQHFENPFDDVIDAVYVFPLPDDSAVNGFEIVVGERTIKGVIQTREEARATYERAKESGHTAALLEQEKANVFTQSVANIPPGETVRVRITYLELFVPTAGTYELVFPMTIGPRYLPQSTSERRAIEGRRWSGPARPGTTSVTYAPESPTTHRVSLDVDLDAGVPVSQVGSPTHRLITEASYETGARLVLARGEGVPNRDFVLRWTTGAATPVVGVLTHRDDRGGFFTLLIEPQAKYREGEITSREVVLVLDTSGSMSGTPLEWSKAIAQGLVSTLRAGDQVNVVTFASGVSALSQDAIAADDHGRSRASSFLSGLSAGGGTQMGDGVKRALSRRPGDDRVRIIYVLSDGFVGNDDEIVSIARKTSGFNRVFTVGIGSSPNRYLLDRLAEEGRGFASYVTTAEETQRVLETLVERSTAPHLTDLAIDWGSLSVDELVPARLPDVYAGQPLVVSGRYRRPGSSEVRVSATVAGERVVTRVPVELPAKADRASVAYLWARRTIHALSREQYDGEKKAIKDAIEALGLEFGLVTDYTSFVAVDETRIVDRRGRVKTVIQPVSVPAGVDPDAALGEAPAPAPSYTPSRGRSSGSGFSGGGDVDPVTVLTVLLLLPLGLWLRRRAGL